MDEGAPRIHCIPAADAPIVAVFRRGPSRWAHVGRWDVAQQRYEPGAWLSGRIFPRRSDLSPDGRHLCCFIHKPGATWEHGETYVVVSRLPWLSALVAFGTDGTWTRGLHFTTDRSGGDDLDMKLPIAARLRHTRAAQFAGELRRGWVEAPDCPPRDPSDIWDQHRNARVMRRQPGGTWVLYAESLGWAGGAFGEEQAIDGLRVRHWLERDGANAQMAPDDAPPDEGALDELALDDAQWADWDDGGRLLVATRAGALQIRALEPDGFRTAWEHDLSRLEPSPEPAPSWARRW